MEDDLAPGRKARQNSAMKRLAQVFFYKKGENVKENYFPSVDGMASVEQL